MYAAWGHGVPAPQTTRPHSLAAAHSQTRQTRVIFAQKQIGQRMGQGNNLRVHHMPSCPDLECSGRRARPRPVYIDLVLCT